MAARRDTGAGSLYTDKAGRWHAIVVLGTGPDGKPIRRHISRATKKEATDALKALIERRGAGIVSDPTRHTVESWLTHWLAVSSNRSTTIQGYRSKITTIITPALGPTPLEKLSAEHVELAWAKAVKGGLSGTSVLQAHRILSKALKVAHARGLVRRNVCELIEKPRKAGPEVTPIRQGDIEKILAASNESPMYAAWLLALCLGLRRAEIVGLRWRDVDLEAATLTVSRTLYRLPYSHGHGCACDEDTPARRCPDRVGGLREEETKSSKAVILPLPAQLVTALKARKTAQTTERLKAANVWRGEPGDGLRVFTHGDGRLIDPNVLYDRWARLLKGAGIAHARLHDARHTAATTMFILGVPAGVVQQILRHASISTTMGIYVHIPTEMTKGALDQLSARVMGTE